MSLFGIISFVLLCIAGVWVYNKFLKKDNDFKKDYKIEKNVVDEILETVNENDNVSDLSRKTLISIINNIVDEKLKPLSDNIDTINTRLHVTETGLATTQNTLSSVVSRTSI